MSQRIPRALQAAALVVGLLMASAAPAPAAALRTESQALARFLEASPAVRAARQAQAIAEADLQEARTWPNPALSADREQVFTAAGPTEQHRLGLSLGLPLSAQRRAGEAVAERAREAATARSEAEVLALGLAFREGLAAWAIAEKRAALLAAQEAIRARLSRVVATRHREGESAGLDARRAALAHAESRAEAEEARAAARRARAALEAGLALALPETPPALAALAPPPLSVLRERTLRSHPALRAARAEVARAESERVLAERRAWPEPTLLLGLKQTNEPTVQGLGYTGGLQWPFPIFDRAQGARARAEAERARAEAELEAAERRLAVSLPAAAEAYAAAASTWRHFRAESEAAEALGASAEAAYREGELGLDALLAAHEALERAGLKALALEASARAAERELCRLSGQLMFQESQP